MSKMNPSKADPEKATDKERDLNCKERGKGTQKGQVDKQHRGAKPSIPSWTPKWTRTKARARSKEMELENTSNIPTQLETVPVQEERAPEERQPEERQQEDRLQVHHK
jgi:hypothetical protein